MKHNYPVPLRKLRASHSGFSLIETLVVIAILFAIVMLGVVGWGKVRESAQRMQSVSNMRASGLALRELATDGGRIETSYGGGSVDSRKIWGGLLYTNGIIEDREILYSAENSRYLNNYGVNWRWYTFGLNLAPETGVVIKSPSPSQIVVLNLAGVADPDQRILLADTIVDSVNATHDGVYPHTHCFVSYGSAGWKSGGVRTRDGETVLVHLVSGATLYEPLQTIRKNLKLNTVFDNQGRMITTPR